MKTRIIIAILILTNDLFAKDRIEIKITNNCLYTEGVEEREQKVLEIVNLNVNLQNLPKVKQVFDRFERGFSISLQNDIKAIEELKLRVRETGDTCINYFN